MEESETEKQIKMRIFEAKLRMGLVWHTCGWDMFDMPGPTTNDGEMLKEIMDLKLVLITNEYSNGEDVFFQVQHPFVINDHTAIVHGVKNCREGDIIRFFSKNGYFVFIEHLSADEAKDVYGDEDFSIESTSFDQDAEK